MCQGRHLVPDAHVRPPVVIEMYVSSYHIPCVLQAVEGFPGIDTLSFYYTVCPFCNGVVGRIGVFGHADADMVLAERFHILVATVLHSTVRVVDKCVGQDVSGLRDDLFQSLLGARSVSASTHPIIL